MIYSDEELWEGKKQIAVFAKELRCSENDVVYALLCIGKDLVKEKLAKDAEKNEKEKFDV